MTLLIGTSSVLAAINKSVINEQVFAVPKVATATGMLTSARYRAGVGSNTTATKYEIGVFNDAGGKPGTTLIAAFSGTTNPQVKETWLEATTILKEGEVKAGTTYWLVLLGAGGVKVPLASGTTKPYKNKSPVKAKALSEVSEWVVVEEEVGEIDIEVAGTVAVVHPAVAGAGGGASAVGQRLGKGAAIGSAGARAVAVGAARVEGGGPARASAGSRASAVGQRLGKGEHVGSGGAQAVSSGASTTERPPDVLLLGSTGEPAGAAVPLAKGKANAFRFQAEKGGLLRAVRWKTSAGGGATKIAVAIMRDGAEGLIPGELIEEHEKTSGVVAGTEETLATFATTLVKGTYYWLVIMGVDGGLKWKRTSSGGAPSATTAGTVTHIVESVGWVTESNGPAQISGEGQALKEGSGSAKAGSGGGAVAAGHKSEAGHLAAQAGAGARAVATGQSFVEGQGPNIVHGGARALATGQRRGIAAGVARAGSQSSATGEDVTGGEATNVHYGGATKQVLDIYPSPVPNSPVVVFVHGGGWAGGEKSDETAHARKLQEKGITVFNIEYRWITGFEPAFPQEVEDVELAFAYARSHATVNNGNPNNIHLLGGSAGGHLVAMAAVTLNRNEKVVRGVISFSGIYDLDVLIEEMEAGTYLSLVKNGETGGNTEERFIEHCQWIVPCSLAEGVRGRVGSEPACSTTGNRAYAREWSPAEAKWLGRLKWLMFNADHDLIPNNQMPLMGAQAKPQDRVTENLIPFHGHALELWNTATVKEVIAFVKEAEGSAPSSAGGRASAAGHRVGGAVGIASAGARSLATGRDLPVGGATSSAGAGASAEGQHVHLAVASSGAKAEAAGGRLTFTAVASAGARAVAKGRSPGRAQARARAGARASGEGVRFGAAAVTASAGAGAVATGQNTRGRAFARAGAQASAFGAEVVPTGAVAVPLAGRLGRGHTGRVYEQEVAP